MKKVLLAVLCSCGGSTSNVDAGPTPGAPVLEGTYAFTAQRVMASTQLSGGGFKGGDNLSLSIQDVCTGLSNSSVNLQLINKDGTALTARSYTVEALGSGTGGNSYAVVDVDGSARLRAKSGTVTMEQVDLSAFANNRGSFAVQLELSDGGLSALSGTFDGRYVCH